MKFTSIRLGFAVLLASGALLIWPGCQTVPVTGRAQFNIISAGEETELGIRSFDQLKKETPASHNPSVNALMRRVGGRIAAVADLPGAQWEFVVFETKEPNAFCLPGGKVGVTTGMLSITKDEAGLAVVIGHEVAHAAAHHGGERMSKALALHVDGTLMNSGMVKTDPRWQEVAATAYGFGPQAAIELPYTSGQESEADRIGLLYMARAGYAPEEAGIFWKRFADHQDKPGPHATPAFLRTHPADETRLQDLRQWLPEAQRAFHPAK